MARTAASQDVGQQSSGRSLRYHPELDGVRAFAIIAVMAFHVTSYGHGYHFLGGFLGVDLFFVLSGYLITTLLLREWQRFSTIHFRQFYARRALRLLPALGVLFVFAYFVSRSLTHPLTTRSFLGSAVYVILYVGNWAAAKRSIGVFEHTWSLAIEEQYYLIWPVALLFALRRFNSKRMMALLLACGAVGVAVLRYAAFFTGHQVGASLWTVTRADGIILGSALALLLSDPPEWAKRLLARRELAAIAAVALVVAMFKVYWNMPFLFRGGLLLLNICGAILVGHLVVRPNSASTRLLSTQPLPAIGRISYGLYLFSAPMNRLIFGNPEHWEGAVPTVLALTLSVGLAVASYWIWESRVLRLKSRFGSMSEMPKQAVPI